MPTTLPRRAAAPAQPLQFADVAIPVMRFYAVIAIATAVIVTIEHHLGLFAGTTFAEAITQTDPLLLIGP